MIIVEGKENIKEWFEEHSEMIRRVRNLRIQVKHPVTFAIDEDLFRQMEVDDIKFLTDDMPYSSERGIYAWFYPTGSPAIMKICDLDEVNFGGEKNDE